MSTDFSRAKVLPLYVLHVLPLKGKQNQFPAVHLHPAAGYSTPCYSESAHQYPIGSKNCLRRVYSGPMVISWSLIRFIPVLWDLKHSTAGYSKEQELPQQPNSDGGRRNLCLVLLAE
ncbi:hypothetical protein E2C01_019228 [Portunus trituberculatus]|uniref:Uncharacterized protein n=1 Tax=Portunus trituberculatus TaxID=210409 RepID=A0A5B7DYG7_PORTR|nr:hypothetical protein [Portunus trituberculatus]